MRVSLSDQLPPDDIRVLQAAGKMAAQLGMRAFVVGGVVRDIILRRPHTDWDIVIEGSGTDFATAFAEQRPCTVVCHEPFLTAQITLPDGTTFDIATARREEYPEPGALPVVEPASIEEDLWRRDFSINAIAADLTPANWGNLLDPAGGLPDIESSLIRALYQRTFWDDATRILRAIGFEQRLGFALEHDTERWLKDAIDGGAFNTLARERISQCALPLLEKPAAPKILQRAHQLGVIAALTTSGHSADALLSAIDQIPDALDELREAHSQQRRRQACLVALWRGIDLPADDIVECICLSRRDARALQAAQRFSQKWPEGFRPAQKRGDLWNQLREANFGAIVALWLLSTHRDARAALADYWRHLRNAAPDFDTQQLLELGYQPGPAFGRAIRAAIRTKLNENAGADGQLAAAEAVLKTNQST